MISVAEGICPACNGHGKKVRSVTVENLVKEPLLVREESYYLCQSADCPVVYFNQAVFSKEDVKVPVWFKEKSSPRPICYCKNVTDTCILEQVRQGHVTLAEIQALTGANTGSECLTKNPAGG